MAFTPRRNGKCQKENCNTKHNTFRTFWWHYWSEHKLFLCAHCGEECQTYDDYINHLKTHVDFDEAYETRQSSTETTDPTEQPTTSTSKRLHREGSSSSAGSLSSTESICMWSTSYKCKKIICIFPTCNWKDSPQELKTHICNEHQTLKKHKIFKCMVCKLRFQLYEEIWWHYLDEHERYACRNCCDLFSTIDTYDEHQLAHKYKEVIEKDEPIRMPEHVGDVFSCIYAFCGEHFEDKEDINKHIQYEHIEGKRCQVCRNKPSCTKSLWSHYWNKHSVFVCEYCQTKLGTYDSYEEHRQTHTNLYTEPQETTLRHDDTSISDTSDTSTSDTSDVNVEASTSQDPPRKH